MENSTPNLLLHTQYLIAANKHEELHEFINGLMLDNVVDITSELSDENEYELLFDSLELAFATKVFTFLDISLQKHLIKILSSNKVAQIINEMESDDRTALLEELPSSVVKELIKLLSEEERKVTLALLGYPEYSVGRLMTSSYIAVKQHWTAQRVLEYVRQNGEYSETLDVIYVIDEWGILIDDIRLREFLFVSPETLVKEVMDNRFLKLEATDDEEQAIDAFKNNNRFALPVTDSKGLLLGIVTIDDVLRLAEEEVTEDMQKVAGLEALDEPYMTIPFLKLMKKRAGWLIILFIGEMLTATAMGFFENEIAKAVILALFVPLIISSGGNSGSQASTLIIRAMAIGEVTLADWWRIMKRETLSGLFLGAVLGLIGFLRVALWSTFSDMYGPHWALVGLVVSFSLVGVVLWGTITGSMLPLILKRLGADPATSSAPFVATLVDVTGLVIYFSVAFLLLKGVML